MLLDLATIIFSARVGQAVFRFYCTAGTEAEKNCIITSALFLNMLLNGIGTVTVILLSAPLAIAIFSDATYMDYIALSAVTIFLGPMIDIPLTYIKATQKPWLFFAFSILKLAIQLSLNIYFVVYLELHVQGVIYSAVISSLVMAVLLILYTLPRTGLHASMDNFRRLFSFSLPMKLATLGSFYMAFGDRYILNIFTDLSQVGVYALGYKFGFILMMLTWDPFQNLWDSEKYNIHRKPDAVPVYQKIFLYISSILIFTGLCISLYVKDLLVVMANPAFLDAYKVAPIIITAYIIQAWTKYCDFGILVEKKTMQIAYAEVLGALSITVAFFTLIPFFGIYGAAWSSVIGFATRFWWINRKSTQFYNMELPWRKVGLVASLAIIIFVLTIFSPDELILSILFRSTLVILFLVTFFFMPVLSSTEKNEIWRLTRSLKARLGI
jgi:O-antigen/teichoic acid export membrane protein